MNCPPTKVNCPLLDLPAIVIFIGDFIIVWGICFVEDHLELQIKIVCWVCDVKLNRPRPGHHVEGGAAAVAAVTGGNTGRFNGHAKRKVICQA